MDSNGVHWDFSSGVQSDSLVGSHGPNAMLESNLGLIGLQPPTFGWWGWGGLGLARPNGIEFGGRNTQRPQLDSNGPHWVPNGVQLEKWGTVKYSLDLI